MPAISPKDAKQKQQDSIPEVIFEVFNEILATGERNIKQDTVLNALKTRMQPGDYKQIFDRGWLDVEAVYRRAGWKVSFDKPGYCEDYEANWTFSEKKR